MTVATRRGELEATSSRACTDVLLDLMYVVTSCVLFDVVRALRRHTACGLRRPLTAAHEGAGVEPRGHRLARPAEPGTNATHHRSRSHSTNDR